MSTSRFESTTKANPIRSLGPAQRCRCGSAWRRVASGSRTRTGGAAPVDGMTKTLFTDRWRRDLEVAVGRKTAELFIGLELVALLCSCASVGTKVEVREPNLVKAIQVVGLSPIPVDDPTLSVCGQAQRVVLEALVSEIERNGTFRVIGADTLVAHVPHGVAMDAEALLSAARNLGLDGVLFCRLGAYQVEVTTMEKVGWGIEFGTSGTHLVSYEEPVTTSNWVGAQVWLQVVESTGKLVLATRFDTFKGKSYWSAPSPERQIRDAVVGAFEPVAGIWAKRGGTGE